MTVRPSRPFSGRDKTYISLPLAVALGVTGIVVLLVPLFLLYPYDSRKPQIEATLSRLAGQPLQVASVQAELTPKSRGSLLRAFPREMAAIFMQHACDLSRRSFRYWDQIRFFARRNRWGATLSKGTGGRSKGLAEAFGSSAAASVKVVRFNELTVDFIGLPVGNLQSEIRLDDKGSLGPLAFHSADRSLKASLKAQPGGFVVDIEALAWQPAAESRFRFDSLQGQLVWDGRQAVVRSLDARIFDRPFWAH